MMQVFEEPPQRHVKSIVKPMRAVDLSGGAARLLIVGLLLAFISTSCKQAPEGDGTAGGRSNPNRNHGLSDAGADCAASCDDGFSCTVDRCAAGRGCVYSIGPNEGDTACPPNRYCTVEQGCIAAPACAEDEDCATVWADDACKDNPRCDPESSVCLFDPLDKDGDGHAPQVCGGDDCNDDDASIRPGKRLDVSFEETCNGIDDNCDGMVDESAFCSERYSCISGECRCLPEYLCGIACTDIATDPEHCGACDNLCPAGAICIDGTCGCTVDAELCGEACINLATDSDNCGGCGRACAEGQSCQDGVCICDGLVETCTPTACSLLPQTTCGDQCVDTASDTENCGGCGVTCGVAENQEASCLSGECLATCIAGTADCDGSAANGCEQMTLNDGANCGGCGRSCQGAACADGRCPVETVAIGVVGYAFAIAQDETRLYWLSSPASGEGVEIVSVLKTGGTIGTVVRASTFRQVLGLTSFRFVVDNDQICWALGSLTDPNNINSQVVTDLWCHRKDDGVEFLVGRVEFPLIDIKSDGTQLYYVEDALESTIWRVNIEEGATPELVSESQGVLELSPDERDIYWLATESDPFTAISRDVLYRAPKAGGAATEVVTGNSFSKLLAEGSSVLVKDAEYVIEIDKGTLARTVLVTGESVGDIATDGTALFWMDSGTPESGADSSAWMLARGTPLNLAQGAFENILVDATHAYLVHSYDTAEIFRVAK